MLSTSGELGIDLQLGTLLNVDSRISKEKLLITVVDSQDSLVNLKKSIHHVDHNVEYINNILVTGFKYEDCTKTYSYLHSLASFLGGIVRGS